MIPIAVLVSGGGTNLQALFDAEDSGVLKSGRVTLVISSNPNAFALLRAAKHHVPSRIIERKSFSGPASYDAALLDALGSLGIGLVVLAGFLAIIGAPVIAAFNKRIINVHPALLPSFGGKGFYGLKVHEAAINRGVKITGATVHYVDETIDGGEIIGQKAVEVAEGDTPESLQKRVMESAEWQLLPAATEMVCQNLLMNESN
jgi:phosphoribosylglycinamide formyltransferase-1